MLGKELEYHTPSVAEEMATVPVLPLSLAEDQVLGASPPTCGCFGSSSRRILIGPGVGPSGLMTTRESEEETTDYNVIAVPGPAPGQAVSGQRCIRSAGRPKSQFQPYSSVTPRWMHGCGFGLLVPEQRVLSQVERQWPTRSGSIC